LNIGCLAYLFPFFSPSGVAFFLSTYLLSLTLKQFPLPPYPFAVGIPFASPFLMLSAGISFPEESGDVLEFILPFLPNWLPVKHCLVFCRPPVLSFSSECRRISIFTPPSEDAPQSDHVQVLLSFSSYYNTFPFLEKSFFDLLFSPPLFFLTGLAKRRGLPPMRIPSPNSR